MSLNNIFDISGSALVAETRRLTTSASNLTNANVVVGNPDDVYRAQYPIFTTVQQQAEHWMGDQVKAGVAVTGIYESQTEPVKRYEPNNPIADADGFVYAPKISSVEEMANVISASRAYEMGINVINTAKQLIQKTLQLGQ
ncbi:Putative proximal rod protein [Legionella massiliensis]|uniref:Flagellar basal-body rod protein FlgC n=1 Tax=Legionella massiliensis TaxID=1034943 RepID=A0A078L243_9GAMM|nr:flagellar basal body rod protein FlgC [Legionella massiliensis]CDZ78134.1 Putative proximal rod protein [Legionella massiliensis]CEE13872.1 Flagellar basal-body rod protein FlgC [Legionella massiliensis]